MFDNVNFEQFGAFAIVFVLMAVAIVYLVKSLSEERKRTDKAIEDRLQEAKESKANAAATTNEVLILTRQIYELLTNNPSRRE